METRVAIIGIILENDSSVEQMNGVLHGFSPYIIGRMGIPYKKRGINIISLAVDAPTDIIESISGEVGKLPGISTKTIYSSAEKAE